MTGKPIGSKIVQNMATDKIKKSLRFSLIDGIFASIMAGMGDAFIGPYALAMKASANLIGILSAVPSLTGSLVQMKSAEMVERLGSRKALINSAVLMHALLWIPVILIPYVFSNNQVWYLIIFYTLLVTIGSIPSPAWSSLMADHVPETERGKVFGWRTRLFGFVNLSSMFIGGAALFIVKRAVCGAKSAPGSGCVFAGFTIIFCAAFICRLVSWLFLTKMYEPLLVIKKEHHFTFLDFLKRIRKSNFGMFVVFAAFMNFSVSIASPYFSYYMLEDLKFNYLFYTIVTIAPTLAILFTVNLWGRYADTFGNVKILRLSSAFIPFIPLFWLASHNIFYLVIAQAFSGFFWAGFNLSVINFMYDAVTPEKRTRCIAYFNVINGIAIFLGAIAGSQVSNALPRIFAHKILTAFLISGILRLLAAFLFSFLKEVRQVKELSCPKLLYSIIGLGQKI